MREGYDLVVEEVCVSYASGASGRVLDCVNMRVPAGSFASIIGPTGAGKSTLLSTLGGLIRPTSGRVSVLGEEVDGPQPKRVGFVFQDASLFPWLTAEENVAFPLDLGGVDRRTRVARARELLELVRLGHARGRRPGELSGGMRQRVAIARSLALDPPVLLMDEPFGALDEQTREAMGDGLLDIWERTGKTIIMVTHSISEAIYLSDAVYVLGVGTKGFSATVPVEMDRPRQPNDRGSETFGRLRNELRRELDRSFESITEERAGSGDAGKGEEMDTVPEDAGAVAGNKPLPRA